MAWPDSASDVLAAIDFTSVEVWTRHGLVTCYLLFVMELKIRRVHFAGGTTSPGEDWLKQAARELTNHEDGFLNGKKHLIMDRDTKFSESFRSFLSNEGVEPVRLPPRSPNMNAHLERFFGSLKSECLDRLILFGEKSMRNAVNQYLEHYHTARPHQGLGNELIVPMEPSPSVDDKIETTDGLAVCCDPIAELLKLGAIPTNSLRQARSLLRQTEFVSVFGNLRSTSNPISAQISASR